MNINKLHPKWLEQIVELWNEEIGGDFPMRKELLYQNTFEDNNTLIEGSFVVINEENKVIAFIVSKVWKEKEDYKMDREVGWIQALLVKGQYRKKGIGTKLLELAENALQSNGVKVVHLGRDPWHYFPGIPTIYRSNQKWFEKLGYNSGQLQYDLIQTFNNTQPFILNMKDKNINISILHINEKNKFLLFLNKEFPGRWEYEAHQYFEKNGDGREFVVMKKEGRIIGFCRLNDAKSPFIAQNVYWSPLWNGKLGGIGPLGISKEERKKGLGEGIVKAAINILWERNIRTMLIDWTTLTDFYGKLNFHIWKEYQQYTKHL